MVIVSFLFFGYYRNTVIGVLIEVPVMLMLVPICQRTQAWFAHDPQRT